jgi:hypothetical protein
LAAFRNKDSPQSQLRRGGDPTRGVSLEKALCDIVLL